MDIMREYNIPVPKGFMATDKLDAAKLYESTMGPDVPVVVKAMVLAGNSDFIVQKSLSMTRFAVIPPHHILNGSTIAAISKLMICDTSVLVDSCRLIHYSYLLITGGSVSQR